MAVNQETDPKSQPSGLSRWLPIPSLPSSLLNPFGNDNDAKANEDGTPKRQSLLASFLPGASTPELPSPEKDDASAMFAEPDAQSNSDDASREGSVDETGRRRSKRNRPKTCFSVCHPAPASKSRQKLHRRTRSLLQLHKLSPEARPRPAYEVVPSANFSVRLTRAITKVFKTKHGLCPSDLVVLKAEKYSGFEPDEEQEARDIVALICKGRKDDSNAPGKAKICLPDGQEWEAYPTLQGGYEFFSTDEHGLGLTVRWVPKRNKDGSKPTETSRRKFNFSTISPNSRRHPVIATLSKTGLDINDTYKMPEPGAATPLSTPKQAATVLEDEMEDEQDEKGHCETDESLRKLIVITSIWVTFKEGWSPSFKYDDKDNLQRSPSGQYSPSKSATFLPTVSTPPGSPQLEKRSSFRSVGSGMFRTSSLLRKSNRNSTVSVPEGDETVAEQSSEPAQNGRARSRTVDSTSTVLVHRAASNRAKHHQATWRPDLLEQREVRESMSEPATPRAGATPRRESVARPILPPTGSEGLSQDGSADHGTPRSVRVPSGGEFEKRESSATTTTTSTVNRPAQKASSDGGKARRKRGGWRRLLCGSQHDI